MISLFGWPDPNTGFDQSEHALYTCYFIILLTKHNYNVSGSFIKEKQRYKLFETAKLTSILLLVSGLLLTVRSVRLDTRLRLVKNK